MNMYMLLLRRIAPIATYVLIMSAIAYCQTPQVVFDHASDPKIVVMQNRIRSGKTIQLELRDINPLKYKYTTKFSQTNLYTGTLPASLANLMGTFEPKSSVSAGNPGDDPRGAWIKTINQGRSFFNQISDLSIVKDVDSQIDVDVYAGTKLDECKNQIRKHIGALLDITPEPTFQQIADALSAIEASIGKLKRELRETADKEDIAWALYSKSTNPEPPKPQLASDEVLHRRFVADVAAAQTFLESMPAAVSQSLRRINEVNNAKSTRTASAVAKFDEVIVSVTVEPSDSVKAYCTKTGLALPETTTVDSEVLMISGRQVIDYSLGLIATNMGRTHYYKETVPNADPILRQGPRDHGDGGASAFIHWIPATDSGVLGGTFAMSFGVSTGTNGKPRYLFGPSISLGRSSRIYITAGLSYGETSRLNGGLVVGQPIPGGTLESKDVFRWGTFISITTMLPIKKS